MRNQMQQTGIVLFEPIHGSYPQAEGRDIANIVDSILTAAILLAYFGLNEEVNSIREGVNWTVQNLYVTKDIDPVNFYFTSTIGDLVSEYVAGIAIGSNNKENIELRKSTII